MRILAGLILGLLAVGCGNTEEPVNTDEGKHDYGKQPAERPTPTDQNTAKPTPEKSNTSTNSPPKPTDQNSTKPTPAKELSLREKVVGSYEGKKDGFTFRVVLLENGIVEFYNNGEKEEDDGKWKIIDGELHVIDENGDGAVYRINKDGSITLIAWTEDGKREDVQNEDQLLFKKIK